MGVKVKVDTTGLEKFAKLFPEKVASALNNANENMQKIAVVLAPEDTGKLKSSIHVTASASPSKMRATTTASAKHAAPQEFGFHHHMSGEYIPGQPYMLPAYVIAKEGLLSELKEIGEGDLKIKNSKNLGGGEMTVSIGRGRFKKR